MASKSTSSSASSDQSYEVFQAQQELGNIETRLGALEQAHSNARLNAITGFDANAVPVVGSLAAQPSGQPPTTKEAVDAIKEQWSSNAELLWDAIIALRGERDKLKSKVDEAGSEATGATAGSATLADSGVVN